MKIVLNQNCTPFCDKKGKYVEVVAVLPTKVVFLYSNDNVIPEILSNTDLQVGDKVYFNEDGSFESVVKKEVEKVASSSNRQSPSRLPRDQNSRF